MRHLKIKISDSVKIAVIGDIHEHDEQFFKLIDEIKPNENTILVSVGDVLDKGYGIGAGYRIINYLKDNGHYIVCGNHEYQKIRSEIQSQKELSSELLWLDEQPWSISFEYSSSRLTILHGGVLPKHTEDDLGRNSDILYLRAVDKKGKRVKYQKDGEEFIPKAPGRSWHEEYDGRFGYICAGHDPQKDGKPKYYKYSCNIDTAIFETGILSSQLFNSNGLDKLIQVSGPAFRKR